MAVVAGMAVSRWAPVAVAPAEMGAMSTTLAQAAAAAWAGQALAGTSTTDTHLALTPRAVSAVPMSSGFRRSAGFGFQGGLPCTDCRGTGQQAAAGVEDTKGCTTGATVAPASVWAVVASAVAVVADRVMVPGAARPASAEVAVEVRLMVPAAPAASAVAVAAPGDT